MEIQEALQWTDNLIFASTGKHLDSLQRAILEGVWNGKEYQDISEEYHCTKDHVRKSACDSFSPKGSGFPMNGTASKALKL
ncbi:MAG: hypothetical protein Fur0025_14420 [Oscillatoriaceae cyanobacterium]